MDTYLFESLDDTFKTEEDCVRFLTFKAIRALIQERQTYSIAAFASLLGVNYRTAKLMLEKLKLALYKQYSRMGSRADRMRKQKVESNPNKWKHTTFNSRKDQRQLLYVYVHKFQEHKIC